MVNVTRQVPTDPDGLADRALWLEQLAASHPRLDTQLVCNAMSEVQYGTA